MAGESKITTNHATIQKWAEERSGKPAIVAGTADRPEGIGMLRISFAKGAGRSLKQISWEDFFNTFDERNLAFLYQDKTRNGKESRFFKFIKNPNK